MYVKSPGIILNNVKLGDKKIISKIYTKHFGLQSFAIYFGNTSKSKIKAAHVQPLNLVELEIVSKEKNEVNRVNEIRISKPYQDINNNILKNCIAGFINELLIKVLKESEANEELFQFIFEKFLELDESKNHLGGWPIHFMMGITQHLGFMPNNNRSQQRVFFNLMDGRFEEVPPLHMNYLDRNESVLFHKLINEFEYFLLSPPKNEERNHMLNLLIQYYRFHIPSFSDFKSLPILQVTLYG